MSATVAETVTYAEDSLSPLTVSKPASFGVGQMLVLCLIQHNNPSAQTDLVAASGWSTASGVFDGVLDDGKVFYWTYTGSEPSTWDFPYKSTADVCAFLFRVTGADVTTPTLVVSTTPTTSVTSPMDSPSVTPTGTDDLLIALISDICNGTVLAATFPTGMTDLGLSEVTGHFMSSRAAYQQLSSGSATGVRTWTSVSPTGITGGTWTIAIKSAASGTSGSATITGAGALTAVATQAVTASAAGAGTLTAAATQIIRGSASITGAGTLAAAVVQRAGTSPAGAGALSAVVIQGATVSPAGAGTLTAATGGTVTGTAAITGVGTVTAPVRLNAGATPAGAGQLTAAVTLRSTVTPTSAGTLTAAARLGAGVTAAAAGQLTAAGLLVIGGTATLAGVGALTAAGSSSTCDCLVHRPNTGTVTRGSTGTVTRPNTGVVTRPCSC